MGNWRQMLTFDYTTRVASNSCWDNYTNDDGVRQYKLSHTQASSNIGISKEKSHEFILFIKSDKYIFISVNEESRKKE